MDHNECEKQMIDMVNRHAEENCQQTGTQEKVFTKDDARTMGIGIKRTILALVTAGLFALAVNSFLMVGTKVGWWAVVAFLAGIVLLLLAVFLLYAQGITKVGKSGDDK
jgi:Flp pilus assembly protein TadB